MPTSGWTAHFKGLEELAPGHRSALERDGRIVTLPRGATIFAPGQAPQGYVLLISGDVRVSQMSDTGREIVLYRVMPGESCALTTACLIGGDDYNAEAVAETDTEAVVVPRPLFDSLMAQSEPFRRFVLAAFSRRMADLFKLVDEVAFQRLDVRLAHKLLELSAGGDEVAMTHQQLATELGTAREVISRQLNELQRRGLVTAGRGALKLVDRAGLRHLAGVD